MEFFGRKEILSRMSELWGKRCASLVTCRGRRRIGKSTLIEKFALDSKARFIKIEGLRPDKDTDDRDEREAFAVQLAAQSSSRRRRMVKGVRKRRDGQVFRLTSSCRRKWRWCWLRSSGKSKSGVK